MAGIEIRRVVKRFGGTTAVDDFSLDVAPGEFVALVGPSGCGKTTTLRIVAGLEAASEGAVFVDGRDVTGLPAKDRNLAMVFQSYALYPHLTAGENIGFALRLQGRPKADIAERVRAAAARLSIDHLLDRLPRQLSGGQRQRVAVARCIVREPSAFLFDEPLSNLDAKLRGAARVEIAKLQRDLGVTTLYVTHDQVEAMTMADRIVLMDEGRVRQVGAPMELYRDPSDLFVASFLGSPPMNLLPGEIRRDGAGARFTAPALSVEVRPDAPEGPATLGIRPETLSLQGPGQTVPTQVLHVEHLGAETLVEVAPAADDDRRLTARLPGHVVAAVGDRMPLNVRPDDLRLFDASGRALPGAVVV